MTRNLTYLWNSKGCKSPCGATLTERHPSCIVHRLAQDTTRGTPDTPTAGGDLEGHRAPAASSAPSIASWQEVEPISTPPRRETRASIEASFAPCPHHLQQLAASLSKTTGGWTPEQRVHRAWKAGNWAAAVRAGPVLRSGQRRKHLIATGLSIQP